MTNSWRLVSELDAFVIAGNKVDKEVYLAAIGKKSYMNEVLRKISNPYLKVELSSNKFKLRLTSELGLQIKHEKFPEPNEWYEVKNFLDEDDKNYRTGIGKFTSQLDIKLGEFVDDFEAVFSESNPGEVYFVSESMAEYNTYFEEMKRRLNCSLFKKTKKWIPGHRYDSETKTYIYLGEFKSRRSSIYSSDFKEDKDKMGKSLLCLTELKGEKTISEVFKTRLFDITGITEIEEPLSMVDSGEVLTNDVTDIRTLWPYMINNAFNYVYYTGETGRDNVSGIGRIFNIFCYQNNGMEDIKTALDSQSNQKVQTVIRVLIKYYLAKYWNSPSYGRTRMSVGTVENKETNIERLKYILFSDMADYNALKSVFYPALLSYIGINLDNIIESEISKWNEADLVNDFDKYYEFSDIYPDNHRDTGYEFVSEQRVRSINYRITRKELKNMFGNGSALTEKLIELITEADQNYGLGVNDYRVINIGTKRNPKEYVEISITLKDVINYLGGVKNLGPEIKEDIMKSKFTEVLVKFDKGSKVQ